MPNSLTVGTPVTQRPRTDPDVRFSPAIGGIPRLYSLPRKAFALYKHAMFSVDHLHLGLGDT